MATNIFRENKELKLASKHKINYLGRKLEWKKWNLMGLALPT